MSGLAQACFGLDAGAFCFQRVGGSDLDCERKAFATGGGIRSRRQRLLPGGDGCRLVIDAPDPLAQVFNEPAGGRPPRGEIGQPGIGGVEVFLGAGERFGGGLQSTCRFTPRFGIAPIEL